MNKQPIRTSDELAATYLQQLQALAFEISVAMDAIARNALTSFQESVAKQEMLCAVLATMANTLSDKVSLHEQPLLICSDTAMKVKIEAAIAAIRQLNLQYAALLKHSGRSIALIVSLCRTHTGQSQEARGQRSKRQTWSCEM